MEKSIKILHITDLHLFANKSSHFLGINPYESLHAVIEQIKKKQQQPDLIIVTGDFSQDFSAESYELAKELIKKINYPIFAIPGNHDNPIFFKDFLHASGMVCTNRKIINDNWCLILLDTQSPGKVYGSLSAEELNFLEKELTANQSLFTIVFLHHHVLPTKCSWLNKIGLTNADEFLQLVTNIKGTKLVICGHIHQEYDAMHKDIRFLATPSTCFQFATDSVKFQLAPLMPGYRWLELHPDGTYTTEVIRIAHNKNFIPDLDNNEGY